MQTQNLMRDINDLLYDFRIKNTVYTEVHIITGLAPMWVLCISTKTEILLVCIIQNGSVSFDYNNVTYKGSDAKRFISVLNLMLSER